MKSEPYKIDVKDFLVKGKLGDRENVSVDRDMAFTLDEENVLKKIYGEIQLTLLENDILAEFDINYECETICARCLKKFGREGKVEFDREYKVGKRVAEEGELIVDKNFQIEAGDLIVEEIAFDAPMKPLCDTLCKGIAEK